MNNIQKISLSAILLNISILFVAVNTPSYASEIVTTPASLMDDSNLIFLSQEALSTSQSLNISSSLSTEDQESFTTQEYYESQQLLTTLDVSTGKSLIRYNGELLDLPLDFIKSASLSSESLIVLGIQEPRTVADIYKIEISSNIATRIIEAKEEIGHISIEKESNTLYWSSKTEESEKIMKCDLSNCSPEIFFSLPKNSSTSSVSSDKDSIIIETNGSKLTICQATCQNAKIINRPSQILSSALQTPYFIWSEKVDGKAEIFLINTKNSSKDVIQLTSASSGDQLSPSLSVSNEKLWHAVWENYSSESGLLTIASISRETILSKKSIPLPGRHPKIITVNKETCDEQLSINLWEKNTKQLLTFTNTPEETEMITRIIELDQLSYESTLLFDGEIDSSQTSFYWRTSKDFNWKPLQIISGSSPLKGIISSAHKKIQLRILFSENKQCFTSLSLNTSSIAPNTSNLADATTFSPSEYEAILPLNLGDENTREETQLDAALYESINNLLTTSTLDKSLNKGPDSDKDGLSDSFEIYLNTDPKSPDTDNGGLNDGSEHLIHQLDPLDPTDDNEISLRINNIQPRSTLPVLDIITGFAPQSDKNVWFYLLDDNKKSITIGNTKTKPDGTFIFKAPPIPENYKGEVLLIASQVSNIRLATLFPKLTQSLSIYLYNEEDILAKRNIIELALDVESLNFSQNGVSLKTLQKDYREVFYIDETSPIQIQIKGKVYGENLSSVSVFSTLLPTLQEKNHEKLQNDPSQIDIILEMDPYPQDIPIDISIQASDNNRNMSTTQTLSFNTRPIEKYPDLTSQILNEVLSEQEVIVLIVLFILSFLYYILCKRTGRTTSSHIALIIMILSVLGTLYSISSLSLYLAHKSGLISVVDQELNIQKSREISASYLTLVKKDENLKVKPHLAKTWSNISDLTWEFKMRKHIRYEDQTFIKSGDIIRTLQEKIAENSSQQQYLSSIDQIIKINDQVFQIITHYPDPLLPQKLTKVSLLSSETPDDDHLNGLLYIPLETSADHKRLKINPWFFDYPFSQSKTTYINENYSLNPESYTRKITSQTLDIIDEPARVLWQTLKENKYTLKQKVSTESYVLLTNRNSFFLKSSETIKQLQNILHTRDLLESYEGESSLSTQFVPPGVVGYNSELKSQPNTSFVSNETTLTLKLHFPKKESELARIIEQILQSAGINIIPVSYTSTDFKDELLNSLSDLILLPLDFELADAGPFLDTFIDSSSPFNTYYKNDQVDELILKSRFELDQYKRLQILKEIMTIIVQEDPAGIPLINRKKFQAFRTKEPISIFDQWIKSTIERQYEKEDPLQYLNPYEES
ncbi:MAG: hypothetical protein P1V18_04375 [Candidatus Gracilibacteria bacterium]|nr:hypothetical protein [Candidatus Gracilibacteria bacterium]